MYPVLDERGEKAELQRFNRMRGCDDVLREVVHDPQGTVAKVKWVRVNNGSGENTEVRCRLVDQELGCGERVDELCVRSRSIAVVNLLLVSFATEQDFTMFLDVKCVFLYGEMRRNVYIEFPRQEPLFGDGRVVGQ